MADKTKYSKIARYWNKRGETYSKSWQSMAKKRLSKMETDLIENVIKSFKKNSHTMKLKTLDIGIGTGRITKVILKYDVEHTATDVSKTMVNYCKEKFKKNSKFKDVFVHDILNPLPKSLDLHDIVTAIRVLSYSPLWKKELVNIYQTMHENSVLIFTFPNVYSLTSVSKLIHGKKYQGSEVSYNELSKGVESVGFRAYKIIGFTRILDVIYDWSNSRKSTEALFLLEKLLGKILGPTFFVRLFYVICKK